MKRRSLAAAIGIVVVTLICVCSLYAHFIQEKVYEESADHLKEIYTQVNNTFSMLVSDNWNHLTTWNMFFEDTAKHSPDGAVDGEAADETRAFISSEQDKWGFTNFYFLNSSGEYVTPGGERGTLSLGQQLDQLNAGNSIVADTVPTSGNGLTVFATPVAPASFDGFAYTATAISYNNHDMEATLDVNAFDGQSSCFVITPAGNLLFSATDQYSQSANLLDWFDKIASFDGDTSLASVRDNILAGQSGITQFSTVTDHYYLTYMPVGFEDWIMVGVVPSGVVNASISEVQLTTIITVSVVLFVVGALVVIMLWQHGRRALDQQVNEVKYREQLFSALSGSTDNIFIMFSPNGTSVDYVSPNTDRILGISAADIFANVRSIDRSLEPGSESLLARGVGNLASNDHREGNSTRRQQQTGELRWYHETLFRATVGETEKLVYVLFDRTKETESRERLQQALVIAKQSNQAKSTFLAKMSHDIRTPINVIMGMTQIARDNAGNWEKTDECLATIQASSQHLLSLINDVLDMSKIESGAIELQEECCNLDDLLRDVDAIMRPQTAAKGQLLTLDAVNVQHRSFAADQLRVRQILLNLLSNAVKYTPDGGMIALHVEELAQTSPNFARLSFIVRDNGMGMSPEFVEHVFTPFERADGQKMQGIQGTGLGMTITKALVDAMGGTIDVASAEGRGTSFTVQLKFKLGVPDGEACAPAAGDEEDTHANAVVNNMNDGGGSDSGSKPCQCGGVLQEASEDGKRNKNEAVANNAESVGDANGAGSASGNNDTSGKSGNENGKPVASKGGGSGPRSQSTSPASAAGSGAGPSRKHDSETKSDGKRNKNEAVADEPGNAGGARDDADAANSKPEGKRLSFAEVFEGRRYLVAEDNQINRIILTELLTERGAQLDEAENGQEAVEAFANSEPNRYDAVLMDAMMPVMDGYEATRAIRALPRTDAQTTPIIALTANAYADDVKKALDAGMNAHVGKPFKVGDLANALVKLQKERE